MLSRAMVLLMPWARAKSPEEHAARLAGARRRVDEARRLLAPKPAVAKPKAKAAKKKRGK